MKSQDWRWIYRKEREAYQKSQAAKMRNLMSFAALTESDHAVCLVCGGPSPSESQACSDECLEKWNKWMNRAI